MATKQNLIDSAYWKVAKIKPGLKFNRKLIEQYIARAWNQVLHDAFRKDLTFLDFYAKNYKAQTVTQDVDTKQYYTELPEAIVQLPDKSEGVREVSLATEDYDTPLGTGIDFMPVSDTAMRLKDNIDAGLSESSVIGYAVRYDRIWYDRGMTAGIAAGGVNLKLVIPFDSYGATEQIPVPSGKDEQLIELTARFMLMAEIPQNG